MIHPTEYRPEHLEQIRPRIKQIHLGEVPAQVSNNAVTIMDDDVPICLLGGLYIFPGIFHIWAIMTDDVTKKPTSFARACRNFLTNFIRNEKPRRLQMEMRLNYPEGLKWANFLGFQNEGIMRGFGPTGEDYYLMSMIPGRESCQQ